MSLLYVFFFQAEDGIRDLVRSRGLGDVYKRQIETYCVYQERCHEEVRSKLLNHGIYGELLEEIISVSYTHLTLPTSDLV